LIVLVRSPEHSPGVVIVLFRGGLSLSVVVLRVRRPRVLRVVFVGVMLVLRRMMRLSVIGRRVRAVIVVRGLGVMALRAWAIVDLLRPRRRSGGSGVRSSGLAVIKHLFQDRH